MSEFSLEKNSELIHFGKTKEYFEEVLSSYNNGNYRSATVMLWSVAVCDVVYKLQSLVDIYNDAAAASILKELSKKQESDPKSSTWELELIEEAHKKTQLLSTAEYENLKHLQQQRHLSAHPVLNAERELHKPSKETVRALLRSTLESVLIKPPLYSQKILDELLADVAESTNVLNSLDKTKKYVESKYLSRIPQSVEKNLFRSLWKLVFKLDDEDCTKNRKINLQVLEVIATRLEVNLPEIISGEKDYFSNIASAGMPLSYLIYFLSKKSKIYSLLNEDAKLKIQHCIKADSIGKTVGWFIKPNLEQHAKDLSNWIKSDDRPDFTIEQFDAILKLSDSESWEQSTVNLLIAYYTTSYNYYCADSRFQIAIPKFMHIFNNENINKLCNELNSNSQCYGRARAAEDYQIIKKRIDELFGDTFDYKKYPNFARRVSIDIDN
jgi:hypothetical protein